MGRNTKLIINLIKYENKKMLVYIGFLLISSIVSITPLLALEGTKGIVKERMDKFKMSKKMMQTIHKIYSKRRI